MRNRLFRVPPADVFEHPPNLSADPKEIPIGPIEGWECYAPNFRGDDLLVLKCEPVVERNEHDGAPFIRVGDYLFWYYPSNSSHHRTGWYQSGQTLRFVRKRS